MGHVAEQLRQAGILEAVCARSANFPVRVPFQAFLARWGSARGQPRAHASQVRKEVYTLLVPTLTLSLEQISDPGERGAGRAL